MATAVTLTSPLGPFQYVARDLTRWPRNGKPPAIDTSRLRGFTVHYAGGPIGSIYGPNASGALAIAADESLIGRTVREHNGRPGLTDVGYNFLVGRSGIVYEGRGALAMNGANGPILDAIKAQYPAGTRTTNPFYVSVFVCVGTDLDTMTPAQEAAVIALMAFLTDTYKLRRPIVVNGHRDVRATACPGPGVYNRLGVIRDALNRDTPPACVVSNPKHPEWACWPDNKSKPTIGAGSHGPAVEYLHGVLMACGYTVGAGAQWDTNTTRAVEHVQRANKLAIDGVCGRTTWAVIDKLAKKAK